MFDLILVMFFGLIGSAVLAVLVFLGIYKIGETFGWLEKKIK